MPDFIKYMRIYVVLVERTSKEYDNNPACRVDFHPRHRHHWHLLIEKEGEPEDWRKWHHCHTPEIRAWQRIEGSRGVAEDFEDFPFVTSAATLKVVPNSMIHVASIEAWKRDDLIGKLQSLSAAVDKQKKYGATCSFFIKEILCYLHKKRDEFRISYTGDSLPYPENLDRAKRKYVQLKLIERSNTHKANAPRPSSPLQFPTSPLLKERSRSIVSKRSFFGRMTSIKERSDSESKEKSGLPQKAKSSHPPISRPQPIDMSLPTSISPPFDGDFNRGRSVGVKQRSQSEGGPDSKLWRLGRPQERSDGQQIRRASANDHADQSRFGRRLHKDTGRKSAPP